KKLGYPTANIQVQHQRKIIPKDGVYAVWCRINGDFHGGMMNIGNRPTFDGQSQTLEVHLFDLDANLYGNEIHVQFLQRIRGEQAFNGAEALKQQLARDEKEAREILSKKEPNIAKQRK
ncbi:MAG: riboflavin kinase, partial [Balneolaceae bacterium]